MPECKFINVHCHLLNFDFVIPTFFRFMPAAGLDERLGDAIPFFRRYCRLAEWITLMNKDIHEVARDLVHEMQDANTIVFATPLMIDLENTSHVKPQIPYERQVEMLSAVAAKYPGILLPFIMFDPRREGIVDLTKKALEEMGFLGVKVYPPLGYHPDPSSPYNSNKTNHALRQLYEYCHANSIPITAHCSKGGAFRPDLALDREAGLSLCHPSAWRGVLEKYGNLRLNFGHFGGCGEFMNVANSDSWAHEIVDLMKRFKHVYGDTSFHDDAFKPRSSDDYFGILYGLLGDKLISTRTIFGTDWLMTRRRWTEREYVQPFKTLGPELMHKIAFENPLAFLFPHFVLPRRIKHFYESKGIDLEDLDPWVSEHLLI